MRVVFHPHMPPDLTFYRATGTFNDLVLVSFPTITGFKEIHCAISRFIHPFNVGERFFVNPARNVNQLPRIRYANNLLTTVTRFPPFLDLVNGTTTYTSAICCAPDFGFLPSSVIPNKFES